MKIWLCAGALLVAGLISASGQGAQADQIKRRARDLSDQNNARQGVPPAAPRQPPSAQKPATPTTAPAASAPAAPVLTPQQKSVAALSAELTALVATNSSATRKRFSQALLTAARGVGKPTGAAADQIAEKLAVALAGAKPAAPQVERLAQDFDGIVNATGMARVQTDAIADDVQAILQKAGAAAPAAARVAEDLKRLADDAAKSPRS